MKQLIIPFKENADIPESHLYAFRVCNSGSFAYKQQFYKLKSILLKTYGHESNYDLQIIKKVCYSCDGKGNHYTGSQCWNCDKGIYQTKQVVLKRYILNGALFHEPIGELIGSQVKVFTGYWEDYGEAMFRFESFGGRIINTINGIIKHEPLPLHPVWSYYYLLWNYDRNMLFKLIASDVKCYQTRSQHKLKRLLENNNPLKAFAEFFQIKREQLEPIDELPF